MVRALAGLTYHALETVGSKGEVKVAEWIRGSALSWTEKHDKNSLSYVSEP